MKPHVTALNIYAAARSEAHDKRPVDLRALARRGKAADPWRPAALLSACRHPQTRRGGHIPTAIARLA